MKIHHLNIGVRLGASYAVLLALLVLRCFALLFLAGMTVLLVGHDRIPRGRGKRDDRDAGAGPPWSWHG